MTGGADVHNLLKILFHLSYIGQHQEPLELFFCDRLGLNELKQIVGAARFGIGAGHVEATEGVGANHRAGAFAIDVEVADKELVAGALNVFRVGGVDSAGEAVFTVVGQLEGVLEVAGFGDTKDRAKDLFLEYSIVVLDVGNDGGLYEMAITLGFSAASDQATFLLAGLDVVEDGLLGFGSNDRTHEVGRVVRGALSQSFCEWLQLVDELVIDRFVNNQARAHRTFLTLEAKGGGDDALSGFVEIVDVLVDDNGVFAAHLGDDALDPLLAGVGFGCQLDNAEADFFGAREGNETRFGMGNDEVSNLCAGAGKELKAFGGEPASSSTSMNLAAMVGVSLEGLMTTVLPVTRAATVIPARMARGKFQGGMITPTPSGR